MAKLYNLGKKYKGPIFFKVTYPNMPDYDKNLLRANIIRGYLPKYGIPDCSECEVNINASKANRTTTYELVGKNIM